jgi:hypothetical protein
MNKNILPYALVGAAAGLAIAHFFPSLGQKGLAKGLTDLSMSLGAKKPYWEDAGIGALVGAVIAVLQGGKK